MMGEGEGLAGESERVEQVRANVSGAGAHLLHQPEPHQHRRAGVCPSAPDGKEYVTP